MQVIGNPQFILFQNLKTLRKTLQLWNRDIFGSLKQNIKMAEDSILSLQIDMDSSPSEITSLALAEAKFSLHNLLQAEGTHWKQKSRVKWLVEGNKNTRFFHLSAKIRGSGSTIDRISLNDRTLESPQDIKGAAVQYFASTFQAPPTSISKLLFDCLHPKVSALQNQQLLAIPDPMKIKHAVFSRGNLSAPGSDGFSGCVFTFCWDIVGNSVIAAIQNFFSSSKVLKASSTFLIALIPKSPNTSTFNDFRPISLLNFSYKIITKIMANRLSPILPHIISGHQAAFIKDRSIHDHIAMAHELIQKLNHKMAGGSLCLKLDISKAFDNLD